MLLFSVMLIFVVKYLIIFFDDFQNCFICFYHCSVSGVTNKTFPQNSKKNPAKVYDQELGFIQTFSTFQLETTYHLKLSTYLKNTA